MNDAQKTSPPKWFGLDMDTCAWCNKEGELLELQYNDGTVTFYHYECLKDISNLHGLNSEFREWAEDNYNYEKQLRNDKRNF